MECTLCKIQYVGKAETLSNIRLNNHRKDADGNNASEKYKLYRQFIAWSCNGCSKAPLLDYVNNPIFLELPDEDTYFSDSSEQIYLNMHDSKGYTNELEKLKQNNGSDLGLKLELENAMVDKLPLRVWGYSQGKYEYLLGSRGLSMKYKEYAIVKEQNLAS